MTRMPTNPKVYLDHNATTGLSFEAKAGLPLFLEEYGNPSSIHWAGRGPKSVLRETRKSLARALGVGPLELVFTSGGSEANNTVIKALFEIFPDKEFITTTVEHPSVTKTFQWLESRGARVHFIGVDREGRLDLERFDAALGENTALVSVMCANNETGVLFPIRELARRAHAKGALFHTDCVQALGKIPLDLAELDVDYASFSGHKFYSPKGTGFLYVRRNAPFEPLIHGGAQERHRRGGTENTLGLFALGLNAQRLPETSERAEKIRVLRDRFEARLLEKIPGARVTAAQAPRLPNTSSLVIDGVDGETLLMSLDLKGFAVSTGAACASGNPEPSPVLLAMGLTRQEAQSSLRVSLGWETTTAQMDEFLDTLGAVVLRLRQLSTERTETHVGL